MPLCDNCGKPMQVQDDGSLYCLYCGSTSGPAWVVYTDQPYPTRDEIESEEDWDNYDFDDDD